jgi:uncharacterized protein (DUF362 family)
MENRVGAIRGTDKLAAFDELLAITGFDEVLIAAHAASGRSPSDFRVVIKANIMVYIGPESGYCLVTDPLPVERLIDHIRALGFTNIAVCESQNDLGRMLKNHNVAFVSEQIGYRPAGRYQIVNLTLERVPHIYPYLDTHGVLRAWEDVVGPTWRDADFRVSFAKCKTHDYDWMTLTIKNTYGCLPAPNKMRRYHIKEEVDQVCSRALRSFPVHFAFVDAWFASDGFQGYKLPHPRELKMYFGGPDLIAVDMEGFRRAGLDPLRSRMLKQAVYQSRGGAFPDYTVAGDATRFDEIGPWQNVDDRVIEALDMAEEVYLAWGLMNVEMADNAVDLRMFPPRNWFLRLLQQLAHQFAKIYKLSKIYDWLAAHNSKKHA